MTTTPSPLDAVLASCSLDPVWFVWVELAELYDDARVRDAVTGAVTLAYGAHYDRVCFESGTGKQFCRARAGAIEGEKAETETWLVRTLTFSLPRQPRVLAAAVEAIREAHSYEEPVLYVWEGYATRADYGAAGNRRDNPNRCWNRPPLA